MPVIVVIGEIGVGKSTVCSIMAEWGCLYLSSDALVADIYASDRQLAEVIQAAVSFPVLTAEGVVDQAVLASHFFTTPGLPSLVEQAVHPRVRERVQAYLNDHADECVVYEVSVPKADADFSFADIVLAVTASDEVRLKRLISRGLTEADAQRRMALQSSDESRRRHGDIEISNDGSRSDLERNLLVLKERMGL